MSQPDRGGTPVTPGSLQPTPAWVLAVWAIAGLVLGWLLHPLSERWLDSAPVVTLSQPLALFLVAVILGFTGWATRRALLWDGDLAARPHRSGFLSGLGSTGSRASAARQGRRSGLGPHQAVNRLVLARACAYVGALVGGGYAGYGLSWVGSPAELADHRMWLAGASALASLLVVITALLLERACRVPPGETGF